ncbi:serine hydrolase domain-containing protein [Methylacidimicrobium tartarophylax]|uniref:Methyl acetate hydrolase n=1 Tax=Methylacidimicrobium tartarophylax TaxID=1041768 RepID=A0A5E6MGS4_9BACT|nr:serine hydrolase domain-containing protein [Methylacidimicrobium tartarophylax]VVM08212.1 methyl acetate hydrolase [Methylacidimicrobium tartarophylax]
MNLPLRSELDPILERTVTASPGVPGVVAMVTDRRGNLYEGAAGKRRLDREAEMTADTVFALYSTTKAYTATAALQLVEEGLLDLDAPAKQYAPEIGNLPLIEGFDPRGEPILRPPKREITTRMLLTHTAGFGYEFFHPTYFRLHRTRGQPSSSSGCKASLLTPLLFEPGERWEYGTGMDWCGQVIEGVVGRRLGEVFAERLFAPLGIESTAFELTGPMRARLAVLHQRQPDGSLRATDFELPANPEVHMGGHGLYGTVGDFMKLIRLWLNEGMGERRRLLRPETIRMAAENQLGARKVGTFPGVASRHPRLAEFLPGPSKSWGLSFLIHEQDLSTGRPAGSLSWAGLANTFFWIDRKNGLGGYWATQLLPFGDPISFGGYVDFESAVYAACHRRRGGDSR